MADDLGFSVEIRAQLDRFERQMRDAGRVVETTTTGMDKATKRAASQFNRLEAALDPVSRATQRYERDVRRVESALEKGAVSQTRALSVLRRLEQQYERSAAGAQQFAATAGRASATSGRMGNAIQQAGFQVGDFATQVASGQGVLRPFIQQGTQLVSMFGPWGAVIGAAGATVGALAVSLTSAGDAADEAADKTRGYSDLTRLSNELTGRAAELARELAAARLAEAEGTRQAAVAQAEKRVATLQDEIAALEKLQRTIAANPEGAAAQRFSGLAESQIPGLRDALEGAQEDLAKAEVALAEVTQGVGEFGDGTDSAAKSAEKLSGEIDSLLDRLSPARKAAQAYAKDQDVLAAAFHSGAMELDEYSRALTKLRREFEAAISTSAAGADPLTGGLRESLARAGDEASKAYLEMEKDRLKAADAADKERRRAFEKHYDEVAKVANRAVDGIVDYGATPFDETPAAALDDPGALSELEDLQCLS